ncbi:MAG: hypothetical protein EOP94_04245, partial [Zymomonas sp.]
MPPLWRARVRLRIRYIITVETSQRRGDPGRQLFQLLDIRHSRAEKRLWRHNDPADLDRLLSEYG